ncbi:MAG: hypothetical protein Q9159_006030 [Coniocarpon cinnabarinum]
MAMYSIAAGRLSLGGGSEEQVYEAFRALLQDDGHLKDPHALAAFDFAAATHASAPRIEAEYQFWHTAVKGEAAQESHSAIIAWCGGEQIVAQKECITALAPSTAGKLSALSRNLDFDRVYGSPPGQHSLTLYADITSADFASEYAEWIKRHGSTGFRLRYKPALNNVAKPLMVNGYGVELALKRTDYIVIDDRESSTTQSETHDQQLEPSIDLNEEEIADIKPLSASELRNLGINAASYIMSANDPFDTLLKISQDFPVFSAALAQTNATQSFIKEHHGNRNVMLPSGFNGLWLNGQQVSPREIDAYSLQDLLRRERTFIKSLQSQGLSASEAISLASYPPLSQSLNDHSAPRYDFRDNGEGGNVIIWLNDLEKDKRYDEWPDTVDAYLQRMFPGQLPAVRKNAHTVIVPVDFEDPEDIANVVDSLQSFVKRTVPIRFGIVPLTARDAGSSHARVLYHLNDAYGLSAVMKYLQLLLRDGDYSKPNSKAFTTIAEGAKLRKGQEELSLADVQASPDLGVRAESARQYMARLGAQDSRPPIFANGVPIARSEEWMQDLSQQLSADLRIIQQAVFEETVTDETYLPDLFLNSSSKHRDPLLVPESARNVTLVDIASVFEQQKGVLDFLEPFYDTSRHAESQLSSLLIVGDFNERPGAQMVLAAAKFTAQSPGIETRFLHQSMRGSNLDYLTADGIARMQDMLDGEHSELSASDKHAIGLFLTETLMKQVIEAKAGSAPYATFASVLGVPAGELAVLINGRRIGPLPEGRVLTADDLAIAFEHEQAKRLNPTIEALKALGLLERLEDPLAASKISALLAVSVSQDVPEGIFDNTPGPRTDVFKRWNASHTCITVGDAEDAAVQLVASIDPSSESAQRWIPIINVLSKIAGVYTRIFLNPKQRLQELPTKRFYRHVLEHKPVFDANGAMAESRAQFRSIPANALLTMTLDVAPPWLVAPKESVHDLDNLRLSSLRNYPNITASYELENILIEGHSRDLTNGNAPRGVQFGLEDEAGVQQAGTIVMANLGYFQFKANPGAYNLALQHGASERIFTLDSAGTQGYDARPGDSTTDILLTSFKGSTAFPRLSRKVGMELADVLEFESLASSDVLSKGASIADDLLNKAGFPNAQASEYLARGFKWGQDVLGMGSMSPPPASSTPQADINIFSVASGHLYERMLNIMMLSVMRHTEHTVKFWFIEQFLSPSFKAFLPTLAAEYGFDFEMVTYKWPHWLRAQTEKQRTIWGYKILFLDVLFPLDLDKVIFVDADQIVRTDMYDLVQHDLEGAPYAFTPMCDSRTEMEGFRFWKQGYWSNFLRGKPYHISALYVVDLKRFRQMAAGDRLRQQYHSLSADPNSLSNLDQDLPNHMQHSLPIHSLPQEWLWCETWCSDEALTDARTIDLCNNPQTKEPKLERARRQVPEWTVYDDEIAALARRRGNESGDAIEGVVGGALVGEQEQMQRDAAKNKDEL